jgi:hypothetical protein
MVKLYNLAMQTDEEELRFDLSKSVSVTPYGIVMLTATLYESLRRGKKCIYVRPRKKSLQNFFSEIGFNKLFRLDSESDMPDLHTGKVRIRRITGIDALITETLMEVISFHVNLSEGVKGSLRMSLNEIMTNVIAHSGIQDYYVCAWTYPIKKQLRLCITDLGIGILNSLKSSPVYAGLTNAHKAIIKATEFGVSSQSDRQGLGLNHIKGFIRVNNGRMCIISDYGKVFWKYDQGKIINQKMTISFGGTIIKLIINTDKEGFYFLEGENLIQ